MSPSVSYLLLGRPLALALLCLLSLLSSRQTLCGAFSIGSVGTGRVRLVSAGLGLGKTVKGLSLRASSESRADDNDEPKFPQLPAIGRSSFNATEAVGNGPEVTSGEKKVAFVGDKFELQYTCKICETRNSHRVSRVAYRSGVVIAVCKGCMSKHLIADNLGWSNYIGGFEGDTNIEEYMETRGLGESVNRVSQEVFELEKQLDLTSTSGALPGEDGELHLE